MRTFAGMSASGQNGHPNDVVAARCVSADQNGYFDLPPLIVNRWRFIMIENFPSDLEGTFIATAPGFKPLTFKAKHFERQGIEMETLRGGDRR